MERPPEHTFGDQRDVWTWPAPADTAARPAEHAAAPETGTGAPPAYYAPPGYLPAIRGYGSFPVAAETVPAAPPPDAVAVPPRRRAGRSAAGWAAGSALLAGLTKIGVVLKLTLPFLSALVSFGAYSLLFGWQFGAGILILLFVHEMGHFAVIRAKGLPASLPVFIPLLGAYVAMRRMPSNVRDEAEIAIAGPLAGAAAGIVCVLLYQHTQMRIFLVLAYFDFFINLLNLLPVSPLDGGRIVAAISRWFWPIGLVLLVVAFIFTHSLVLLLLAWLGLSQTIARFRAAGSASYYAMPLLHRAYITVAYFGLAACLALGMLAVQRIIGIPTL
ncbi:MAG: site-2 protease family protein [Ktedonobacterales bacterium]